VSSRTDLSKRNAICVGAASSVAPSAGSLDTNELCADAGAANPRAHSATRATVSRRWRGFVTARRGAVGSYGRRADRSSHDDDLNYKM